jgi:hypothetical protein
MSVRRTRLNRLLKNSCLLSWHDSVAPERVENDGLFSPCHSRRYERLDFATRATPKSPTKAGGMYQAQIAQVRVAKNAFSYGKMDK